MKIITKPLTKIKVTFFALACLFVNICYAQTDLYDLVYPVDEFTEDAVLDLSYLNEGVAGENGFIQLSENGEDFVNGNGDAVRFWAIGGGGNARRDGYKPLTDDQLAYFAKFLAKKGVNMIRFHGHIHSITNDIEQVNTEEVDAIWRLVAAMKKEGIYTTISPYWAGSVDNIPSGWELGDYEGSVKPWGLMYFEDKLKNAYKTWVEYLFSETNLYTGIALKDDPAVALIQIKNEDGVFWYTQQDFQPSLKAKVESQFYDWLITKYTTIENAYVAWENTTLPEDNTVGGRMGQYKIWDATQDQTGGKQKRLTDQIEFYADVQRGFYGEIYEHYKDIGCQQLISGNNWKTASPTRLFDAERWTNEVCDVMAANRYYHPDHIGDNSGWRIEPNHQYVGSSALRNPHKFPINTKQVKGKPFIMSESGWNLPHKYQAEGPFLIASYMSLTGFDAYYWFSPTSYSYDELPYFDFTKVNGQMPMFRWTVSTPGQIGMFPANALMYRRGFIQKGDAVVHEERTLQSIYEREVPIISEDNSFDPNRDSYGNAQDEGETDIPPIAHLTGQVTVKYNGDPLDTYVSPDLENMLDLANKKIGSITDELSWDYNKGICLLDAPAAKGFCGFPGGNGSFSLTDVTIKTTNDYVVVNVVAMDDKPINESKKILIQVGTVYRPKNWSENPSTFQLGNETVDGFIINNVGEMPWQAINSELSVVINNANIQSARVLDMNGYEAKEIWVKTDDTSNLKEVMIPKNGMYIVADARPSTKILGLNDEMIKNINIFPNPSDGKLNIESPSEEQLFTDIEILDLSGKILKKIKSGKGAYDLKLPNGIYIINLIDGSKTIKTGKILIDK